MKVIAVVFMCLVLIATCSAFWNYPYPGGPYHHPGPYYNRYDRYDRYDFPPWGHPYHMHRRIYNPYYGAGRRGQQIVVPEVVPEAKTLAIPAIPVPEVQHYMI